MDREVRPTPSGRDGSAYKAAGTTEATEEVAVRFLRLSSAASVFCAVNHPARSGAWRGAHWRPALPGPPTSSGR